MNKVASRWMAVVVLSAGLFCGQGWAKNTIATSAGNWNGAIWNSGVPADGDDVAISNGVTVTLTNSSPQLSTFTVSGSLVFSNWDTRLSSTTVTINGSVTLPSAFTNGQMSNRVYFACSNLTLATNASINVVGKGYAGGLSGTNPPAPTAGSGPGGGRPGTYAGGGASYAGLGQHGGSGAPLGPIYGAKTAPLDPGSGGGGGPYALATDGSAGGGAVRIDASGTVVINGTILTDAGTASSSQGGGGSGGSIYITCRVFAGTNGVLSARGSNGGAWYGGAGSAGRIAVVCNEAAQNGAPRPMVSISTKRGYGIDTWWGSWVADGKYAGSGTVYLNADHAVPDLTWNDASLSGFTNYTPTSLTVTNARLIFEEQPAITVASNLSVTEAGRLDLYNPNLTVTRDMIIDNASLYVYANTNGNWSGTNYDGSMSVGRTLLLGSNGWIYPVSDPTNGGAIRFTARNVTVSATNSGFNANVLGYAGGPSNQTTNGFGPGGGVSGTYAAGGGYGGAGGDGVWGLHGGGGHTYGASNAPVLPGSGGGGSSLPAAPATGGGGGGLIWIEASRGTVTLNGSLTANGQSRPADCSAGGGAGGGIYLTCRSIVGTTNAMLSAIGGNGAWNGWGGGGGGGRIAVWAVRTNGWSGTATAARGVGGGRAAGTRPRPTVRLSGG